MVITNHALITNGNLVAGGLTTKKMNQIKSEMAFIFHETAPIQSTDGIIQIESPWGLMEIMNFDLKRRTILLLHGIEKTEFSKNIVQGMHIFEITKWKWHSRHICINLLYYLRTCSHTQHIKSMNTIIITSWSFIGSQKIT